MNKGTEKDEVLQAILAAQVTRNLNNTALIQKANNMEHCKKNIMLTLLLFWDKVFTDITDILVHHESGSKRVWNVNDQCLRYLKANELANPFFAEFFFKYHAAMTEAFLTKLSRELNNGLPYLEKFGYLTNELSELLNLAQIALDGLRISCETFGGEALCIEAKKQLTSDCGQVDNLIVVMVNDEHMLAPDLLQYTLDATLPYVAQAKEKLIMILDYRNLRQSHYVFGEHARARYELASQYFEAIYLYHCDMGMVFDAHFEGLEKFVIPNRSGLKKAIKAWREKQEIITFG